MNETDTVHYWRERAERAEALLADCRALSQERAKQIEINNKSLSRLARFYDNALNQFCAALGIESGMPICRIVSEIERLKT